MVFESFEYEGVATGIGKARKAASRAAAAVGTQRTIAAGPSKENSTAPASPRNRLGPAAGRQKTSFHQWFGNSPRRAKESDSRHGCRFLTTSDDSSILIGSLSI